VPVIPMVLIIVVLVPEFHWWVWGPWHGVAFNLHKGVVMGEVETFESFLVLPRALICLRTLILSSSFLIVWSSPLHISITCMKS